MTLLRSDAPVFMTDSEQEKRDLAFLKRYGITTVIDMRLAEDVAEMPGFSGCADQLDYHNIPIREGDAIPESTEDVPCSYLRIAQAQSMPEVFRTIAQAREGVLFHCSAGKDRSGTVAAILLLLAGAGRDDIVKDYMLTKENNKERFEQIHNRHPELDMDIVIPHEEYMNTFLDLFEKKYRSAENYMLQIGLSENEIREIKGK
jgi:protein tyrosine/serine phosphatase